MSRERAIPTLVYPSHHFEPEDLLNFWEMDWFYDSWEEMKLVDEDMQALQCLIMSNPKGSPVIPGTSSLRKLRFSPEGWNTGKSNALRVCYVYFEKYGHVLLSLVFKKGDLDNLSAAGKRAINKAIARIESKMFEKFGF